MNFEELLTIHKSAIERYAYFRIPNKDDADELLQESYLVAFQKFSSLTDKDKFKSWLLAIVRNKCNDYYRFMKKQPETIKFDEYISPRCNIYQRFEILEIIKNLSRKDSEILNLFYIYGFSINEISVKLNIPMGTVKSRLHNARRNFKNQYYDNSASTVKGDVKMNLPKTMPNYTITKSANKAFFVNCEELMGWMIVPRVGEKTNWAIYDMPERKRAEVMKMEVTGKAEIHGIEGVEIIAKEYAPKNYDTLDDGKYAERKIIAQLTDSHCRVLAEIFKQGGVTKYYTFLDDDGIFLAKWGYGQDNCGKQTYLSAGGIINRNNDNITCDNNCAVMDVVGRYTVEINGKEYDTVCLMDIETYDEGVVTEQYIDKNGRTILWRRFNADNWQYDKRNMLWSDKLPNNEKLYVNGKIYVNWYDCISDYIL